MSQALLQEVARTTTWLAVTWNVPKSIVAAVDASRGSVLAAIDATLLDDLFEFVQGQSESQVTLLRLVVILVVNGFRGTDAARRSDAVVFTPCHLSASGPDRLPDEFAPRLPVL